MRSDSFSTHRPRAHVVRLVRVLECGNCGRWTVYELHGVQAGSFDTEREARAFAKERAGGAPRKAQLVEALRTWCPSTEFISAPVGPP